MSAAPKLILTESYSSLPQHFDGLIYGPFASAPHGISLGVNILGSGEKACSFNCLYCNLGRNETPLNKMKDQISFATLESLTFAFNKMFERIHREGPAINSLLVSGNGEPTLHPKFQEIMSMLVGARNLWLPGRKISVLTNGAHLDQRKTTDALNQADERIVKIDAGNEKTFKAVNAPISRANLARVISGVRSLNDFSIQSTFFEGEISNTKSTDIDDWIEVIAMLKPRSVLIKGVGKSASIGLITACEEDTLYSIASRLERKTQIKAQVLP